MTCCVKRRTQARRKRVPLLNPLSDRSQEDLRKQSLLPRSLPTRSPSLGSQPGTGKEAPHFRRLGLCMTNSETGPDGDLIFQMSLLRLVERMQSTGPEPKPNRSALSVLEGLMGKTTHHEQ